RHDSERIQQRVREYQRKGEHDEVDEVEEERRAAEDEKRMLDREPEPVEAGQEEKGGTDGHKDVQKGGRVFLHFDEIEDGREARGLSLPGAGIAVAVDRAKRQEGQDE